MVIYYQICSIVMHGTNYKISSRFDIGSVIQPTLRKGICISIPFADNLQCGDAIQTMCWSFGHNLGMSLIAWSIFGLNNCVHPRLKFNYDGHIVHHAQSRFKGPKFYRTGQLSTSIFSNKHVLSRIYTEVHIFLYQKFGDHANSKIYPSLGNRDSLILRACMLPLTIHDL